MRWLQSHVVLAGQRASNPGIQLSRRRLRQGERERRRARESERP